VDNSRQESGQESLECAIYDNCLPARLVPSVVVFVPEGMLRSA
jgi:hypothetical protein